MKEEMKKKGAESLLLTSLDDIAWLFNMRGNDIDYNHTIILDNKFIENIINRGDKDINEYLEEV